jgi:hypothetical protein
MAQLREAMRYSFSQLNTAFYSHRSLVAGATGATWMCGLHLPKSSSATTMILHLSAQITPDSETDPRHIDLGTEVTISMTRESYNTQTYLFAKLARLPQPAVKTKEQFSEGR